MNEIIETAIFTEYQKELDRKTILLNRLGLYLIVVSIILACSITLFCSVYFSKLCVHSYFRIIYFLGFIGEILYSILFLVFGFKKLLPSTSYSVETKDIINYFEDTTKIPSKQQEKKLINQQKTILVWDDDAKTKTAAENEALKIFIENLFILLVFSMALFIVLCIMTLVIIGSSIL